jgi:serine/threonine protein phosphatase PrpC
VVGSDGLFDNLSSKQIAQIVLDLQQESTQKIASTIATAAYKVSLDPRAVSPFTEKAFENGIVEGVLGGKPDDITVVVLRFTCDVPKPKYFAKL